MYDNYEFIKASLSLHSAVAASEKSCYSRDLLKYGYIAPDNLSWRIALVRSLISSYRKAFDESEWH